jgi:FAD dependent oxidoreductase
MSNRYNKIIIGAGLYGLYSAEYSGKKGEKVLVLEYDDAAFKRATYINQARVHMGYHYPRSFTTAIKSANYYNQFDKDYNFSINNQYDKIYAISTNFSWTNSKQFERFCEASNIPCKKISSSDYFKEDLCEGTYLTKESTYDAKILLEYFLKQISILDNVEILYNTRISSIQNKNGLYEIALESGQKFQSDFILNATYASINQIIKRLDFDKVRIKYELCEVILCKVCKELENVGITVMDGPFFSLMPFGKTGLHSLTSVSQTPHKTSFEDLPTFDCQKNSQNTCSPNQLGNCNTCIARPKTSWNYMLGLAKKYLKEDFEIEYIESLFSIKPVLKASEIDDSRPTIIKKHSSNPTMISVLSGKINTVYDLNETLDNGNK